MTRLADSFILALAFALASIAKADGPVVCSWYDDSPADQGRWVGQTASGEPYDVTTFTAAHKTLPFGTVVLLVADNGSSVSVKVTDRGPFVKGRDYDLSPAAFERLAPLERGLVKVKATILFQPRKSIYYRKKGRQ